MHRKLSLLIVATLGILSVAVAEGDEKKADKLRRVKHRVTGLFMKGREKDLKSLFVEKLPNIKLISVDFESAEAVFEYVPAKAFPYHHRTSEQMFKRFTEELRYASDATFGLKPLLTTPRSKLKRIEIPVAGCHCKACNLAAYHSVYELPGVERATASFHEGRVIALIDPSVTDSGRLEAALKKRGVTVKTPSK